jgi:NAD(P)H-flavin reductase
MSTINDMLPQVYRATRVWRETIDTRTVEFEPEDGGLIPPFACGQFNMLYVFGVGEIPLSMSGNPCRSEKLVHTIRMVGPVSKALCTLKRGDSVGVRGPFGNGWPVELAAGKDVVLVGGGLGLAPLRPVVYQVLAEREKYGRIVLLCSAHTPSYLLYQRELETWRARFDLEVGIIVGHATSAWRGNVGYVTKLIPKAAFGPANTIAMVCGPEVLMRSTATELERQGVAAERIFLSMERSMKCGIGLCGHCQYGPYFICKDGPVFQYSHLRSLLVKGEI